MSQADAKERLRQLINGKSLAYPLLKPLFEPMRILGRLMTRLQMLQRGKVIMAHRKGALALDLGFQCLGHAVGHDEGPKFQVAAMPIEQVRKSRVPPVIRLGATGLASATQDEALHFAAFALRATPVDTATMIPATRPVMRPCPDPVFTVHCYPAMR